MAHNVKSNNTLVQSKTKVALANIKRALTLLEKAELTAKWADHNAPESVQRVLWAFNFVGGGFNQVYATTLDAAIAEANIEFGSTGLKIDKGSFRAIRTREGENQYYASLPLMD